MISKSLTLLTPLLLLLIFSCKKEEAETPSQEELIAGNYVTIKRSSWSGGPNGGSQVIDSNRVVSVTIKEPGILTFTDSLSATTFDLGVCQYSACSWGQNYISYGYPVTNQLNYHTITGQLNVLNITSISAGGGSSVSWTGYKIP